LSAQKATNKTSAKKQATARKVGIKNVSNSRSSAKKNAGGNAGSGGRGNGGNTGSGVSGKGRNAGNAGNSGRGNGRNAGNTGRNAGRNSNRNTAADNDERMYEADKPAVFDSRIRRELLGIFIAIVAIALFIAVVAPGNAILPGVISDTLRTVFGIGAYIMPFMMFIWAASYFVEQGITGSSLRLVLGLSIIFFSVLSIASALTPGAIENPDLIFEQVSLMKHGGYIGGGVAWFLFSLVGMVISFVILAGLLVFGCVLIGFSITNAVSRLRELVLQRQEDLLDPCDKLVIGELRIDLCNGSYDFRRMIAHSLPCPRCGYAAGLLSLCPPVQEYHPKNDGNYKKRLPGTLRGTVTVAPAAVPTVPAAPGVVIVEIPDIGDAVVGNDRRQYQQRKRQSAEPDKMFFQSQNLPAPYMGESEGT